MDNRDRCPSDSREGEDEPGQQILRLTPFSAGCPLLHLHLMPETNPTAREVRHRGIPFLIDTGTDHSTIPRQLYNRLKWLKNPGRQLGDGWWEIPLATAGGPISICTMVVEDGPDAWPQPIP